MDELQKLRQAAASMDEGEALRVLRDELGRTGTGMDARKSASLLGWIIFLVIPITASVGMASIFYGSSLVLFDWEIDLASAMVGVGCGVSGFLLWLIALRG